MQKDRPVLKLIKRHDVLLGGGLLFRAHLGRHKILMDIGKITVMLNGLNGLVYLTMALSYILRDAESELYFEHLIPGLPISDRFMVLVFVICAIPWFILPRRFWILSLSIIPMVAVLSSNVAYLLVNGGNPLWPVPVYTLHLFTLLVLNLHCYIQIGRMDNNADTH